jgi:hypothetical protein
MNDREKKEKEFDINDPANWHTPLSPAETRQLIKYIIIVSIVAAIIVAIQSFVLPAHSQADANRFYSYVVAALFLFMLVRALITGKNAFRFYTWNAIHYFRFTRSKNSTAYWLTNVGYIALILLGASGKLIDPTYSFWHF